MKVEKNKVIAIDYTLTDNDGVIIDTSNGREPLAYIHGNGMLIPGMENALEGKAIGDKFDIVISPEEGYGVRNEGLVQQVPKEHFANVPEEIKPGMQFQANAEQGPILVTVMEVTDTHVVVDGNHPLSGVVLNFKVEVKEVRDASAEELEHGHVHGPGGHQH